MKNYFQVVLITLRIPILKVLIGEDEKTSPRFLIAVLDCYSLVGKNIPHLHVQIIQWKVGTIILMHYCFVSIQPTHLIRFLLMCGKNKIIF